MSWKLIARESRMIRAEVPFARINGYAIYVNSAAAVRLKSFEYLLCYVDSSERKFCLAIADKGDEHAVHRHKQSGTLHGCKLFHKAFVEKLLASGAKEKERMELIEAESTSLQLVFRF